MHSDVRYVSLKLETSVRNAKEKEERVQAGERVFITCGPRHMAEKVTFEWRSEETGSKEPADEGLGGSSRAWRRE